MQEAIAALVIATAALLGSPGPATLSLAAVGATSGISRGLPYYAGILVGLLFAMLGAIAGLATVLTRWPQAGLVIQSLGAAYILFVAWKIATAPTVTEDASDDIRHPNFRDGFILNILNAKAYAAFLALFSQLLLPIDDPIFAYLASATVCFGVAIVVDAAWLFAGGFLQTIFRNPRSARLIRIVFGILIVASVIWMLWSAGIAND
jgi:threonine/homoserine/homoserine lactone efflux protein